MASNNSFNTTGSDLPKGSGQWQSGSVVREIEGHFNRENEPRDAAPIDHTGGVPGVDFKDRLKQALPGHHSTDPNTTHGSGTSGHGHGLGSGTGTGTAAGAGAGVGSGLTGSGSGQGSAGLGEFGTGTGAGAGTNTNLGSTGTGVPTTTTGSDNTGSGLTSGTAASSVPGGTHGISERAEHELGNQTSGTGTHSGTAGSGIQKELSEAATANRGNRGTTTGLGAGTESSGGHLGSSSNASGAGDSALGHRGDPATTHDSTTAEHDGKQKTGLLEKVKQALK